MLNVMFEVNNFELSAVTFGRTSFASVGVRVDLLCRRNCGLAVGMIVQCYEALCRPPFAPFFMYFVIIIRRLRIVVDAILCHDCGVWCLQSLLINFLNINTVFSRYRLSLELQVNFLHENTPYFRACHHRIWCTCANFNNNRYSICLL